VRSVIVEDLAGLVGVLGDEDLELDQFGDWLRPWKRMALKVWLKPSSARWRLLLLIMG
jgi:hypothetical protein